MFREGNCKTYTACQGWIFGHSLCALAVSHNKYNLLSLAETDQTNGGGGGGEGMEGKKTLL